MEEALIDIALLLKVVTQSKTINKKGISGKNKLKHSNHKCSLKEVLDILVGKWSLPIIYTFSMGTIRLKNWYAAFLISILKCWLKN